MFGLHRGAGLTHTRRISISSSSSTVQGAPRRHRCRPRASAPAAQQEPDGGYFEVSDPAAEPIMLFRRKSTFNHVRVVQIPDHHLIDPCIAELRGSRIMVLDGIGNIHSIWRPSTPNATYLTRSFWDVMATLPSLSPAGTLGIMGLCAGTVARLIHAHYPEQQIEGWELDPVVVEAARLHMGLSDLEASGHLVCHTGDALSPDASVPGGFSSIAVDIWEAGKVHDALTEEATWRCLQSRLAPGVGARVMANLGQSYRDQGDGSQVHPDSEVGVRALDAMLSVFGEVSVIHVRNMDGHDTENVVAISGCPEELQASWQANMPGRLKYLSESYVWQRYTRDPVTTA